MGDAALVLAAGVQSTRMADQNETQDVSTPVSRAEERAGALLRSTSRGAALREALAESAIASSVDLHSTS